MEQGQHIEEDKVLVAQPQLFVPAQVVEEDAAQVCVQGFRGFHGLTVEQVHYLEDIVALAVLKINE